MSQPKQVFVLTSLSFCSEPKRLVNKNLCGTVNTHGTAYCFICCCFSESQKEKKTFTGRNYKLLDFPVTLNSNFLEINFLCTLWFPGLATWKWQLELGPESAKKNVF